MPDPLVTLLTEEMSEKMTDTQINVSRKVAIVICCYPLGTATLVLNSIAMLCEKSVHVDIISDGASLAASCNLPDKARILKPDEDFWDKIVRKLLTWKATRRFFSGRRLRRLARLSPSWASFACCLRPFIRKEQYDLVLCISYPALFAYSAYPFAGPAIYYNMELLDDAPDGANLYLNKSLCRELEQEALINILKVIAMSEDRAEIFCKTTGFPRNKVSILPIVPRKSERIYAKGTYFREKFDIPADVRIVVYSGGIGQWALLREIMETVPFWPKNHALVIHTWEEGSLNNVYGRMLQELAKGMPVYFSLKNFVRSELLNALSSGDVGIAYYDAIDENFRNIVFSSNKICEYLLAGLPIVCSPFPALKSAMDRYGFGQAVAVEDIPSALVAVADNEQKMKTAIRETLEKELQFDEYFDKAFPEI
jgi:glycosyltransferase involved in cell wall biosynthesis